MSRTLMFIAGALFIATAFVCGRLVERAERPPRIPVQLRTIDPKADLGCDTPELRLFLARVAPQVSFISPWEE